jgi:hypothetical protein
MGNIILINVGFYKIFEINYIINLTITPLVSYQMRLLNYNANGLFLWNERFKVQTLVKLLCDQWHMLIV